MRPSAPVVGPAIPDPATPASASSASSWRARLGQPPRRPLLQGLGASLMMLLGSFGAGGVLVRDPLLTNSALGFWRYGHGHDIAMSLIYGGVALMLWAWIELGRKVIAGEVRGRAVLTTAAVWLVPVLFCPPLFTRDIFSYLAQGALPLAGFDPYAVGPDAMPGIFTDNVHYFWQSTPAPYGPLFILIAKGVVAASGGNIILGVLLMRLALLPGLVLLVWALPELARRLGGKVPVALWIAVANPMMVIHMVGGGHNDLLSIGLLAAGSLMVLRGRFVIGIVLVTLAMAVKASVVIALPFLVLIWAAHMTGTRAVRILKAAAAGIGVFVVAFAACTLVAGVSLGWLPALSAPAMIVNWMSIPTGIAELLHSLVGIFVATDKNIYVIVLRIIGGLLLVTLAVKLWWASRDGGPEAVRRAGVVLLAVAVLSPATLPWYLSWGMALLACVAWTTRGLQYMVFVSLLLVIVYQSNGEDALYNVPYLLAWGLVGLLAAVSLVKPDPLRLAAGARSRKVRPVEERVPGPVGAVEAVAAAPPLEVPPAAAGPAAAGAEQRSV